MDHCGVGSKRHINLEINHVICHFICDKCHIKPMAHIMTVLEDALISRTVELLGGRRTLHRQIHSRLEAHDLIQQGLPGYALKHLVSYVAILQLPHHGTLEKAIGISLRTYQRRKDAPDKPLSPEQSGRTWKFAEILGRATEVFGSQPKAEEWLERPAMAFEQRKPIDLLSTPAGVQTVEDHLTRLEYGVYT
jgi:putative toxin-antitoxin system antitoxin component (TIGR02293 family)